MTLLSQQICLCGTLFNVHDTLMKDALRLTCEMPSILQVRWLDHLCRRGSPRRRAQQSSSSCSAFVAIQNRALILDHYFISSMQIRCPFAKYWISINKLLFFERWQKFCQIFIRSKTEKKIVKENSSSATLTNGLLLYPVHLRIIDYLVEFLVMEPIHVRSSLLFNMDARIFFEFISGFNDAMFWVVDDVPHRQRDAYGDFIKLKICRSNSVLRRCL